MSIKVVFAFDVNYELPALVAALSLLDSSKRKENMHGGGYDLYFLTSGTLPIFIAKKFETYLGRYSNCNSIKFLDSLGVFEDSWESRHITKSAYLRLEIPRILDEERVIYVDVDVLFLSGLMDLWSLDIGDCYLAAALDVGLNQRDRFLLEVERSVCWKKFFSNRRGSYFQSGLLLMNLRKIREVNFVDLWGKFSRERLPFHDMDIINLTCYPHIRKIEPRYNIIVSSYARNGYVQGINEGFYEKDDLERMKRDPVMLHYTGLKKPWIRPIFRGSKEYWSFLKAFPGIEREIKERYPWHFWDHVKKLFVKPLFD